MLNCRFFDEVFEAGEHFNKQPTSMPPKNSGKVAMRRSSRLETFKQNSHLDEHLLDSNEYSTWITEKSNSSTARRSIYLIALCVLTLLSASFIKLNLSNNDKAIVQQTQEILEALHQAQGDNARLLREQQALETKLHNARNRIDQLKAAPQPVVPQCPKTPSATATLQTSAPLKYLYDLGLTGVATEHIIIGFAAMLLLSASTHIITLASNKKLKQQLHESSVSLREALFDKENTEQSLELLETELQRKLGQLADAQQKTALPRGTPRSTPARPPSPTTPVAAAQSTSTTPGKNELPPPPSVLVERFLEERRAVAVEEEQIIAWLEMEEEYKQLQSQVDELKEQLVAMKKQQQGNGGGQEDWTIVASKSSKVNKNRL